MSDELSILHFGDLHLWRFGWGGDFWPKRVLGQANLIFRRRRQFPPVIANLLLSRLAQETADYVLFSGDLTTTSLPEEFEAGARAFKPLHDKWAERLIMIPGNHDRYTPRAMRQRWFEQHLHGTHAAYPFVFELNDYWTLIGFDCSVARFITSTGRIDAAQFEALEKMLETLNRRGRQLMAMGHYPLLYPPDVHPRADHLLEGRSALLDLFRRHHVALYLHGHKHIRWGIKAAGMILLNCGPSGMLGRDILRAPGYLKIVLSGKHVSSVRMCILLDAAGENSHWTEISLELLEIPIE